MTRKALLLPLCTLLLLPAAHSQTWGAGKGLMETNGTIRVGQEAPPIAAADLEGRAFSLESFRGKPVFVDFGSVLCEACGEMVKEMNRLMREYENTDLQMVMIVDGSMPVAATKDFFTRLQSSFTVVRDAGWTLFDSYGVTVVPFKVLIDRQGNISKIHLGFDQQLDRTLDFDGVLAGKE